MSPAPVTCPPYLSRCVSPAGNPGSAPHAAAPPIASLSSVAPWLCAARYLARPPSPLPLHCSCSFPCMLIFCPLTALLLRASVPPRRGPLSLWRTSPPDVRRGPTLAPPSCPLWSPSPPLVSPLPGLWRPRAPLPSPRASLSPQPSLGGQSPPTSLVPQCRHGGPFPSRLYRRRLGSLRRAL
jgi:hypothetical protein